MYIFDADTHISLTEKDAQTVEQLLRNMDAAAIDRSLVWLQPPYMRDIDEANRYVYESAKRYPDRLTPFGWVDPHLGLQKAYDTIRCCADEYGMKGIKLNGAQNVFYIDDEREIDPIISRIEEMGLALALHVGADFYDHTHPYRCAKIARRHPNLRMLIAHMGGAGIPNLGSSAIEFAAQHANMLLIGSAISYKTVMKAIESLGADRVCFGSDAPFAYQHVEVAAYHALLKDAVSEDEKALIMGENLKRFLKM